VALQRRTSGGSSSLQDGLRDIEYLYDVDVLQAGLSATGGVASLDEYRRACAGGIDAVVLVTPAAKTSQRASTSRVASIARR